MAGLLARQRVLQHELVVWVPWATADYSGLGTTGRNPR